jgi:hypothetical protein
LTFPFSKTVFILISPPQEQKNFWVALEVRAFLLARAISFLLVKIYSDSSPLRLWIFCMFMHKIPINGHAFGVCMAFYTRSATNSQAAFKTPERFSSGA